MYNCTFLADRSRSYRIIVTGLDYTYIHKHVYSHVVRMEKRTYTSYPADGRL